MSVIRIYHRSIQSNPRGCGVSIRNAGRPRAQAGAGCVRAAHRAALQAPTSLQLPPARAPALRALGPVDAAAQHVLATYDEQVSLHHEPFTA